MQASLRLRTPYIHQGCIPGGNELTAPVALLGRPASIPVSETCVCCTAGCSRVECVSDKLYGPTRYWPSTKNLTKASSQTGASKLMSRAGHFRRVKVRIYKTQDEQVRCRGG